MACSTDLFQEHRASSTFFMNYPQNPCTPVDGPLHLRTKPRYIVIGLFGCSFLVPKEGHRNARIMDDHWWDVYVGRTAEGIDARGWYGQSAQLGPPLVCFFLSLLSLSLVCALKTTENLQDYRSVQIHSYLDYLVSMCNVCTLNIFKHR